MTPTEEDIREQAQAEAMDDRLVNLARRLGATAGASAVFGEPVERDGTKIVPVARARWGVGGGSGRGKNGEEEGSGGGGGVMTTPVGFIELNAEGAEYRRINGPLRNASTLLALPFAIGLAVIMVMVTAAMIARRMLATLGSVHVPWPHLSRS